MINDKIRKQLEEVHRLYRESVLSNERVTLIAMVDEILRDLIVMKENIRINQRNIVLLAQQLHDAGVIKSSFRKPDGTTTNNPIDYINNENDNDNENDERNEN